MDQRPSTLRPTGNGYQPGGLSPIGSGDGSYNRPGHAGGVDQRPSTLRPTSNGYPSAGGPIGSGDGGYQRPANGDGGYQRLASGGSRPGSQSK